MNHGLIRGPSLTETSLCGPYLYYTKSKRNEHAYIILPHCAPLCRIFKYNNLLSSLFLVPLHRYYISH